MPVPAKKLIVKQVLVTLRIWSGIKVKALKLDQTIKKDLKISGYSLRTLSGSLRSYIQEHNRNETLTVREIGKAKTVGGLTLMVLKKITGNETKESDLQKLVDKVKEEFA